MEGKWTRGPWSARGSYIYGNDGETVASVLGYYEANARFIAQAPAMATKLEATHQYLREQGHDEMADEIEAILTAIKGE